MRVCYVILHYQNLTVTKECINGLFKIKSESAHVVIVDNASPNKTGEQLRELYISNEHVTVILNEENAGFAKGNNLGFLYAKNELMADTIVVMNSDVIINQPFFESKVKELTESNNVHIIAPDIVSLDGKHQNPQRTSRLKNHVILRRCLYHLFWLFIMKIPFVNSWSIDKSNKKRFENPINTIYIDKELTSIIPHGSCLIFTNNYIKNEDFAFLPITFLFIEEDILYEYLLEKNYKSLYSPELQVKHLEDASINSVTNSSVSRKVFNSKYRLLSLIALARLRLGLIKM